MFQVGGSARSANTQLTELLCLTLCRRICCGQWQFCQKGLGGCTATGEKGSGTRVTGHAITLVILLQRMKGAACVSAPASRCLSPLFVNLPFRCLDEMLKILLLPLM